MKNILIILLFSFLATSAFAQEYQSHNVKKGETVYSIAKQYGISERIIFQLNPDAKKGISESTMLILPVVGDKTLTELKKHRVKRKETIKSIAQKYKVSEDDLKKYNKDLYARGVKKGERINIPIFKKVTKKETPSETTEVIDENASTHIILPKETKYGIARKYGISIAELEQLNPTMGDSLQIGQLIVVPKEVVSNDSTIIQEDDFEYYTVLPKEGFFRLKIKLGLTEEQIVTLNPYAKEGLKEGMILKIPKKTEAFTTEIKPMDLENHLSNFQTKKLVVMLPFKLNRMGLDSINSKELLAKDPTLRVAVDFYSGVIMATEFAKDQGISSNVKILDTEASVGKVGSLIDSNDFSNVDAVIGPLLSKNIEKAVSKLAVNNVPIFSPLSKVAMKQSANLYQTIPSIEMMEKKMLSYIKKHSDSINIIVITGSKWTKSKGVIMESFPEAISIVPKKDNYFYQDDIKEKIDITRENWIILDSNDPILVSNVIGLLNGFPEVIYKETKAEIERTDRAEIGRNRIRLFAINKSDAFSYNDVSNVHLANLNFTFPSVNKHYDYEVLEPFLVSYKNKHGVLPNKYAIRGFDVTYDILLRLAASESLEESIETGMLTEYIENKFQYTANQNSGYINTAFYIVKYNDELKLEIVE